MSNLPSKQPEAPTCEALSDDELQAVSGGVGAVFGGVAILVKPFKDCQCVQGAPFNIINNRDFYQVLNPRLVLQGLQVPQRPF
jgi:bacteriocin-like protein